MIIREDSKSKVSFAESFNFTIPIPISASKWFPFFSPVLPANLENVKEQSLIDPANLK